LSGRILVAHVADIEKAFLGRWLSPVGFRPTRFIDTDVLSRLVIVRNGGPLVEAHVGLGAVCAHSSDCPSIGPITPSVTPSPPHGCS
jgi:hypothetical protein